MNTPYITAILAVTALSFSTVAMAERISKREHKASAKRIEAEYKSALISCDSFVNNVRNICMAEAKRTEKVAKAELNAKYKPSRQATYGADTARAKSDYSVTMAKCNDRDGNAKDLCKQEAKAALASADSEATTRLRAAKVISTDKSEHLRDK